MAKRTSVTEAPWAPDGSLLHYPGDYRPFSHYESDTGEHLDESEVWEEEDIREPGSPWGSMLRQIRTDVKVVYHKPEWRPNEPFHATLQVDAILSGRSAKYLMLRPVNLPLDIRTFPMFVTDLLDVARQQGISVGAVMPGRWMVAKRGANYGLRLAKEDE